MASVVDDEAGVAGFYDPEKGGYSDQYKLSETTPVYIRHQFIRKVFTIVFLQLLFSFGFMLLAYYVESMRAFFIKYQVFGLVSLGIFFIASLVISFVPSLVRNTTGAFVAFGLMTPLMAIALATICCHFKSVEIAIAGGITTAVVLGLTLFAIQTKYSFTTWIPYVFVAGLCFMLVTFITFPLVYYLGFKTMRMIYAGVGALFCSIYILIDVQLIVGGGRKYEYSVDDYCLASIALYTDIITIFIDILRLVSS
ncbi:Inhibitor of apoptosis-promoting Bax1 family protein [Theileria parva strain Muguga]|uniref:N-methyl-aspartate receptor, putative n=1 Tax=Theileria parva TaxID=5875 RepID=Q4N8D6_THEPA|nr:Inhibitor of apoptosis-promoting Bax1 family protein [Theileria parva strain Muguga]EAN33772.1 Inhibitor of apoptosis-promoting Bax1 family protein [Theileria parva strain Muguga]|eukprot:XP_766055.1 N-methyl-aspartate receptor [Theileria parva strain Muguga]